MHLFLSGIGFGITNGAVLAVAAMGFSLQFGVTNVLNLAYGSLMTVGAIVTLWVTRAGLGIWWAVLVGACAAAAATFVVGRTVVRAFAERRSKLFTMAIVTVALSLIIDYLLSAVTHAQIAHIPFSPGRTYSYGGLTFTSSDIIIVVIAAASAMILEFFLHFTRLGVATRAAAANPGLARASGVNTSNVAVVTWLVSGLLCGLGGALLALSYQSVSYSTGTSYLPYVLAVVIVAGIGAIGYGAIIALILELAVQIAGVFGAGDYSIVIALAVLLVMLLTRPSGLFGQLWEKTEVFA
jgi:branched-chain amino acid transport system permease protein/neutral amino acid transport system permease protein